MKTIVLGYDDSPEAARALTKTVELAKALDARVVVTSVAPALHPAAHGVGPYDPADPPDRHRALANDAVAVLTEHGIRARPVVGAGDPADAIVGLADDVLADVIVVGMTHHPRLARVLGSVSDAVSHHAACDVLLVR